MRRKQRKRRRNDWFEEEDEAHGAPLANPHGRVTTWIQHARSRLSLTSQQTFCAKTTEASPAKYNQLPFWALSALSERLHC